jgi:AcrR family transcriptional regulator
MGPRGLKRREELLQAALDLFAANGYEATSTRSIAEQTGVTEAVLFKHFASKQELFLAVLQRFGPENLLRLPVEELDELPLAEALARQVEAFLESSRAHRPWLHALFHTAKHEAAAGEELKRQFQSVHEGVRRLLERRVARGEVRPEMVEPGQQIISLAMRGFNMRSWHHASDNWEQNRDTFVKGLIAVVMGGISTEGSRQDCTAVLSLISH